MNFKRKITIKSPVLTTYSELFTTNLIESEIICNISMLLWKLENALTLQNLFIVEDKTSLFDFKNIIISLTKKPSQN